MVVRDSGFLKKQRLDLISKEIAKHIGKGVDVEGLLNWIEYNIGLSREKAKEYIALVCRVHNWEQKEGKIQVVKE